MPFSDGFGYASAAMLGFIHGDVPGAFKAVKYFTKYKSMGHGKYSGRTNLATPRAYKKQTGLDIGQRWLHRRMSMGGVPMKRRASYSSSSSGFGHGPVANASRRRQNRYGGSKKTSGGNNNLNNATIGKRKGRIGERHKKHVPVSKNLRKKIKTVMEDKGAYGKRTTQVHDNWIVNAAPAASWNFKFDNAQGRVGIVNGGYYVHFTPNQILNSASILFNNKTPTLKWDDLVGGFNREANLRFHIKYQKVTYLLKNNTQRHRYIKAVVATPKNDTEATFMDSVDNILSQENIAGLYTDVTTTALLPAIVKENRLFDYEKSRALKQDWKMETTIIKLDPGASYSFAVKGFDGQFDYNKHLRDDVSSGTVLYTTYPRNLTKFVAFCVKEDMVNISSGTSTEYTGRWLAAHSAGAGIAIEVTDEIAMNAPGIKPLALHDYRRSIEDYANSVSIAARVIVGQDMDDEGVRMTPVS